MGLVLGFLSASFLFSEGGVTSENMTRGLEYRVYYGNSFIVEVKLYS